MTTPVATFQVTDLWLHGTETLAEFLLRACQFPRSEKTLRKWLTELQLNQAIQNRTDISPDSEEMYGVVGTDSLNQKTYGKLGLGIKKRWFVDVAYARQVDGTTGDSEL